MAFRRIIGPDVYVNGDGVFIRRSPSRKSGTITLEVMEEKHDYLVCAIPGKTAKINVAKPRGLRAELSRGNIVFTYIKSEPGKRTATLSFSPNDIIEQHVISPAYLRGEMIEVMQTSTDVMTEPLDDPDTGEPDPSTSQKVKRLQVNPRGRWAAALEEDQ